MKPYKIKEAIISFLTFLFLIVLLLLYYSSHHSNVHSFEEGSQKDGEFNFEEFDFDQIKLHKLNGNVEFYWNQLLTPTNFSDSSLNLVPGLIPFPKIWNNYQEKGEKIGSYGYGTYHFNIILPEEDIYALKITEIECAYKLWVNGELLAENGKVARSKKEMIPSWQRKLLLFHSSNKKQEIVLQVSNFHHRKGGADNAIIIGKASNVITFRNKLLSVETFLLGFLFILSIYHLVLFVFRYRDKTFLFFSILCWLLILRLITTGEEMLPDIIPGINWYTSIRIEYISYILAMPALLLYIYQFYKEEVYYPFVKIYFYVAIAISIFVLVASPRLFTYTPIVYQIVVTIITLYILYCLFRAFINKRENSFIFLSSYILYMLIIINDLLYFNHLITTGYLMPFGIFILAYVQSVILSKNVSLAFIRMEDLSSQLDVYSKKLEKTVEQRTHQIKLQKDEIQDKANSLNEANKQLMELSSFKDSLTEMIIHDLKNPLNTVLNFSKDQRVVFAGTQMLNLVHNLLDVQRYENSKMQLHQENLSLNTLIQKAVYQMNFLIKEKNISLKIIQENDYFIYADEDIMNRVLVNLLSNAIKFTPGSGKVIIFYVEKKNAIEVCISDTGPGIPSDQKKIIFEKFGQFISRGSGKLGSTGLGLTFCKMAIEAHEGSIDFTSVMGKGTTFCCTLPLVETSNGIQSTSIQKTDGPSLRDISFSTAEKRVLQKIIERLSDTEIYEIGKLKTLISEIDQDQSENISPWISALLNSIWNSDQKKYSKLLEMAKIKKPRHK